MKILDLSGKKFNNLTILKLVNIGKKGRYWECLCDCGNIKIIYQNNIVTGRTRSCGHLRSEVKIGEQNPFWKGNRVGYGALHDYVKCYLPKPKNCQECNKPSNLDLANKSGKYLRDLSDWEWLCRKCHMTKDGRIEKLKQDTVNGKYNMYGKDNPSTKLTDAEVLKIKKLRNKNKKVYTLKVLASEFNVSIALIHCIVKGKLWKNI